jgi:hypothetical protein
MEDDAASGPEAGRPRPPPRRRLPSRLALLALLALAIGIGVLTTHRSTPGPSLPGRRAVSGEQLGANTGRLFNGQTYPQTVIAAQLSALRDAGASLARSDASWEATEPQPPSGNLHHYDWSFDDLIASMLAANGLTWLPVIDYSPPWARSIPGQDHSAPDPAEYAAYAAAVAARYGPGGSFWRAHPQLPAHPVDTYEIWNEPDNPVFWVPRPDPAAYATLYLRARNAIDAVQPDARVIVGGLTHPESFLPALITAAPDLRTQLDGVGIHPYGATPQAVLAGVVSARNVLNSLGLGGVPLYVTEFGWTTSPPGAHDYLSARLRPSYIQQTLGELGHTNCGLAAVLLYAWVTPERDPQDAQDWFGIHPPGGGTSPDTAAFTAGVRAATAPGATNAACAS